MLLGLQELTAPAGSSFACAGSRSSCRFSPSLLWLRFSSRSLCLAGISISRPCGGSLSAEATVYSSPRNEPNSGVRSTITGDIIFIIPYYVAYTPGRPQKDIFPAIPWRYPTRPARGREREEVFLVNYGPKNSRSLSLGLPFFEKRPWHLAPAVSLGKGGDKAASLEGRGRLSAVGRERELSWMPEAGWRGFTLARPGPGHAGMPCPSSGSGVSRWVPAEPQLPVNQRKAKTPPD